MKILRRAVAIATLCLCLPVAASAAVMNGTQTSQPSASICANDPGSGNPHNTHVWVCFDPAGDKLYVGDREADGRSAYGYFNDSRISTPDCRNRFGNGTWAVCDFDVPERIHAFFVGYTQDNEGLFNPKRDFTAQGIKCTGNC